MTVARARLTHPNAIGVIIPVFGLYKAYTKVSPIVKLLLTFRTTATLNMASKRACLALRPFTYAPKPTFAIFPTPQAQTQTRAQSNNSSTSALAYKTLHRRISPLPTNESPLTWSPAAAVSSILYETPLPSQSPPKRHILNCLVQNEPGVLSRVSGILAARGFNIDSLVVCNTEVDELSRMTIVLQGQDGVVEQARRQLEDLVPVWAVLDYTQTPLVQRELLLAKVSILGPEYFEELLAHHREFADRSSQEHEQVAEEKETEHQEASQMQEESLRQDFHPSKLAQSEALRHKHEHLTHITELTHQFGGKVLDISNNNCIVEVSAKPTRIDSFLKLLSPFGILESARTGRSSCHMIQRPPSNVPPGLMALPRSPLTSAMEEEKEAQDVVDQSMLPPG